MSIMTAKRPLYLFHHRLVRSYARASTEKIPGSGGNKRDRKIAKKTEK